MSTGWIVGLGIAAYVVGFVISFAVAKHNRWGMFSSYADDETAVGYTALLLLWPVVALFTGTLRTLATMRTRSEQKAAKQQAEAESARLLDREELLNDIRNSVILAEDMSPLVRRITVESITARMRAGGFTVREINDLFEKELS